MVMATELQEKLQINGLKNYLIDMDGVLISGSTLIPRQICLSSVCASETQIPAVNE
jgi:hypothetical protein